jgi:hypothetical protein
MDESLLRIEGWPDRSGRSKLQNPFALRYRYFPATACPAAGFRADGHRPSRALRAGRRLSCRLKSAFSGASRRASAFADARDVFSFGAGRPMAEGLGADGNRPSEALARQASAFADAKSVFPVGAGRPMAEGLGAD